MPPNGVGQGQGQVEDVDPAPATVSETESKREREGEKIQLAPATFYTIVGVLFTCHHMREWEQGESEGKAGGEASESENT